MSQIQISLEGSTAIAFAEALQGLPGYEVSYAVADQAEPVRGEKLDRVDRVVVTLTAIVGLATNSVKLEKKGLGPKDYCMVEVEKRNLQLKKGKPETATQTLRTTHQKTRQWMRSASALLVVILLGSGEVTLSCDVAGIQALGTIERDDYVKTELKNTSPKGTKTYQQFPLLTVAEELCLLSYHMTGSAIITTLKPSVHIQMKEVNNFIDSALKKDIQTAHEYPIMNIAWSPDGQILASGSEDRTIKLWRRDGTLLSTLKGHLGIILSVAWSPDSKTLASGSSDTTIKLWRHDGTLVSTLGGHQELVQSVAWSPDGQTIASGSSDNTIKLWRRDGSLFSTIIDNEENNVGIVAWSPDGQTIASGSHSRIKLWKRDGTLLSTLKGHKKNSNVNTIAWSPDGKTIASGGADSTIKLWRRDGTLISSIKGHQGAVMSVAWSPDGQTIASGSSDNTIKLWRRYGTLISTIKGHQNIVWSVAWSPDGQTLASGSEDNTIKLWRR
jgi:hypothetical protein